MSIGPVYGPLQRSSLDRDVDELLRRVEDLERVRVVVFEYPNRGSWLEVKTDSHKTGTNPAILLQALGAGLDAWIQLAAGSNLSLIQITETSARVQADEVTVKLPNAGDGIFTVSGEPEAAPHLGTLLTITDIGQFTFRFHEVTSYLRVYDNAGDPIMRLDNDGTLHLKVGAAIVRDL